MLTAFSVFLLPFFDVATHKVPSHDGTTLLPWVSQQQLIEPLFERGTLTTFRKAYRQIWPITKGTHLERRQAGSTQKKSALEETSSGPFERHTDQPYV